MNLGREDKLGQLERIIQSRTLQGSESLKSFLKYVALKSINESTDHLKEYTIATEVFGRSNSFSPRSDSVVRVQAKRLRDKLQEYYTTEGKSDRILIELPKGHYNPVFSLIEETKDHRSALEPPQKTDGSPQRATAHLAASLPSGPARQRGWIIVLGGTVAFMAIAVILLAVSNRALRSQVRESAPQNNIEGYGAVWEPFLRASDPTLLILSNPAVYRFTNPMDADALLKDAITLSRNQIKQVNEAVGQKFMIKHSQGQLILSTDEYTGMGEAIGLARLTDLFRSAGLGALLKQSRTVSPEDLKNHNVILLGSVWVNEWSGKLPINEHFSYTSTATIENRNLQPGEERQYGPKFDSAGKLIEDYGLITVKPNMSFRNTVMILAGIHSEGTQAAAEYVTNDDYLKILNERLRQLEGQAGPPKYYQALLKVAVDNGIPTTISLLSVHELNAQKD
jgi:hypothetical protein